MIFDCFMFNGEIEQLNIRMMELGSVVDWFVAIQSTRTHSGQPRQVQEISANKLISVVVTDQPGGTVIFQNPDPARPEEWAREAFQRNRIAPALAGLANPGDMVLISDCDEIPSAESVIRAAQVLARDPAATIRFRQPLCYFYLNAALPAERQLILCTRAVTYSVELCPQQVRMTNSGPIIEDGGWHFSWLGDAEAARAKIRAFAHQELNRPEITDPGYLEWCIGAGRHPADLRQLYRFPVEKLPKCVRDNQEIYERYLAPRSIPEAAYA